jgi:NitT/TauT family transport system substrate-binding protein
MRIAHPDPAGGPCRPQLAIPQARPRRGRAAYLLLATWVFWGSLAVSPIPESGVVRAAAAPAGGEVLLIPYTAVSAIMSPLWVAVEENLFAPYGITVQTVNVSNGAVATAGMLGGSYLMIMNDGPSTISAAAGGADVVMVATLADRVNQAIMTRPGITSAQQLRGRTVGVTTLGTLSGFAMQLFLQHEGIPLTDVNVVQLQTLPAMGAALTSGKIDAAPFSHPLLISMRRAGMHELTDMWTLDIPFLATGLETTRTYLNAHRQTVRAVVEGLTAGVEYIRVHPGRAVSVIQKYTKITDRAALEETWSVYAHQLFLSKLTPSVAGAETVIRLLGASNPKVKGMTPGQVLDASLIP